MRPARGALAAPLCEGFALEELQLGDDVRQARTRHKPAHAHERFHGGVVQPDGTRKARAPLRAARKEDAEGLLVLGPEVEELLGSRAGGAVNRDEPESRQGFVGLVVGVVGGRRVMVWSGGELTAREQARRLPQFFSLPRTPQASM